MQIPEVFGRIRASVKVGVWSQSFGTENQSRPKEKFCDQIAQTLIMAPWRKAAACGEKGQASPERLHHSLTG